MSYVNKGSTTATVTVSMEPDRSGNFVCDGAADEVQINAAVARVVALGGGSVELGAGSYSLDDEIDITASDITLRGQGLNTMLTQTAVDGSDTVLIFVGIGAHINNVIIENLKLVGNAQSGDGIRMRYCDHGIIRDCWLSEHGNHCIYFDFNSYSTLDNHTCYNNTVDIFSLHHPCNVKIQFTVP